MQPEKNEAYLLIRISNLILSWSFRQLLRSHSKLVLLIYTFKHSFFPSCDPNWALKLNMNVYTQDWKEKRRKKEKKGVILPHWDFLFIFAMMRKVKLFVPDFSLSKMSSKWKLWNKGRWTFVVNAISLFSLHEFFLKVQYVTKI